MEEASDGSNYGGESCGRQQWRWKLRTTMSWVEEASEVSIGGGGNCGLLPGWWKELHMEVVAAEGIAHES